MTEPSPDSIPCRHDAEFRFRVGLYALWAWYGEGVIVDPDYEFHPGVQQALRVWAGVDPGGYVHRFKPRPLIPLIIFPQDIGP